MMLTQKTLWAEFLWAWRSHEENPWLWHQHRRLHGKNSYGQNVHMKKIPDSYDATQMTLWAEFLWAKRSHEENPRLHWHQHRRHYGQNSYGRNACTRRKSLTLWRHHRKHCRQNSYGRTLTWRKSLTLMTLTQKTQWAEFLWAKRSLEENPLLYWHQHGRLHGRKTYGRTLTWRKTTAPPMPSQKTLWAEFLWAKRLFETLWDI